MSKISQVHYFGRREWTINAYLAFISYSKKDWKIERFKVLEDEELLGKQSNFRVENYPERKNYYHLSYECRTYGIISEQVINFKIEGKVSEWNY